MDFNKTVYTFLRELAHFDHDVSGIDLIWDLIFPDKESQWYKVRIIKYKEIFYINHIDGNSCGLEIVFEEYVKPMEAFGLSNREEGYYDPASVWEPLVKTMSNWLKKVEKDWIKANKQVQELYPLTRRFGVVPNSPVRESLPDIYRIDEELGKKKYRDFIGKVENGYFTGDTNCVLGSMTTEDYFNYCRIAYIAGKREDENIDESLNGREMYELFADGRHEGLLDINQNSTQEFSDWIDGKHPRKTVGGHPFEIKRGGNTTHIDLSVFRPSMYKREGFKIELRGNSIGRIVETINMFLAIQEASLPVSIENSEGIRKRLLGQDNIGIIPSYETLHRANQQFDKDKHVYDVMYYSDLGRYKRRLSPFITWEPLPILKPKKF